MAKPYPPPAAHDGRSSPPGGLTPLPFPPLDALDAIEDERIPAALLQLAAMQSHLAARLAGAAAPVAAQVVPAVPPARWVTAEEYAAEYQLPKAKVYALARQGVLPSRRFGRSVRIDAASAPNPPILLDPPGMLRDTRSRKKRPKGHNSPLPI